VLTGNLSVFLPASITNRLNTANQASDAVLAADVGSGFVPLPVLGQVSNTLIAFNGLSVTVPASGNFSLRISNIRAAVNQLGFPNNQPIRAQLAFSGTGSPLVNQSFVVVAFAQPGLLTTLYDRGQITCGGSPLPSTVNLTNLFATGTFFSSARLTEGYASSFHARATGDDSGTRFLIKYSGFPSNAHLFLPDFIAGSSAAVPTSSGDLGLGQSGGTYVPGSSSLLLGRVNFADATGAGGFVPAAPTGGPVTFDSVTEVPLTGGSGYVVYEVLDSNPALRESAQIPTFVGIANVTAPAVVTASLSLAPVSTIATASTSAPIPRFAAVPPASDCSALGDCDAGYFPKLSVTVGISPIQLTAVAGGALTSTPGYIPVQNSAGGRMSWTASVQYVSGTAGWAKLDNTAGVNAGSVRIFVDTKGLAAGTYNANVTIDAGPLAGVVIVPVVLTVSPAPAPPTSSGTPPPTSTGTPPPATSSVQVSRVVNAATFDATPLVAGSLGTVMGSNLAGKSVSVTFDGLAADLMYTGASQINLRVPPGLAGKNSATMVVTVDGVASAPQTVILAPAWPTIFSGGVLNQDYSVNGSGSGAASGSIIQVYATGIPDSATVSVQIGNRKDLVPLYAGPAPTVPGVQQVNVAVPDGLVSGGVDSANPSLVVCVVTSTSQFCSPAYALVVQ